MGATDKVLNYHDVLVRAADLKLLEPGQWLNDQVISFVFEWLTHEEHAGACASSRVLFLAPSISFLASMCGPDEAGLVLGPLDLGSKQLVVAAVNDNIDVSAPGGGSHWSLLAYERSTDGFRHYDSSPSSGNYRAAYQLATVLRGAGCSRSMTGTGDKEHSTDRPQVVQVECMPAQQNGYDCGCYACAVALELGSWAAQGISCSQGEQGLAKKLTPAYITELRNYILRLIQARQ